MTTKEKNLLDKKWKEKVKELGVCEISGQSGNSCQLHAHHFYGRRNLSTRWYLPNGFCLSASVHKLSTLSAHESPEWFRGQAIDVRGEKWLSDLRRQFNKTFKGTFNQVLDYLEGRANNYV